MNCPIAKAIRKLAIEEPRDRMLGQLAIFKHKKGSYTFVKTERDVNHITAFGREYKVTISEDDFQYVHVQ